MKATLTEMQTRLIELEATRNRYKAELAKYPNRHNSLAHAAPAQFVESRLRGLGFEISALRRQIAKIEA